MPSFKDVTGKNKKDDTPAEPAVSKAASALLASHTVKDARLSVRVSSSMLAQFNEINSKLGATNGSVLNTLMAKYIMENKDLLD